MEILVIDGQGGGLGRQLVAAVKKAVPQAQVRPVMKRFCFQEGFTRHSTARPTPAPVQRPATRLEKRSAPST